MAEPPAPPSGEEPPPDDWLHRHPDLSNALLASAGGLSIAVATALAGSDGWTIVIAFVVGTAVLLGLLDAVSRALRYPVAASLLTGRPRGPERHLGPVGDGGGEGHWPDEGGGGGGDGGGWGGGDFGGGGGGGDGGGGG